MLRYGLDIGADWSFNRSNGVKPWFKNNAFEGSWLSLSAFSFSDLETSSPSGRHGRVNHHFLGASQPRWPVRPDRPPEPPVRSLAWHQGTAMGPPMPNLT